MQAIKTNKQEVFRVLPITVICYIKEEVISFKPEATTQHIRKWLLAVICGWWKILELLFVLLKKDYVREGGERERDAHLRKASQPHQRRSLDQRLQIVSPLNAPQCCHWYLHSAHTRTRCVLRFFFDHRQIFWKGTKDQSDCGDIYLPVLSVRPVGFTGTLFTRLFDWCLDAAFTQLFKAARLQTDML